MAPSATTNDRTNGNDVASTFPRIIAWDYTFAPNAQKSRNYLNILNIPWSQCAQPALLPRPILTEKLQITYRRIPILSIGKDMYPDNSSFLLAAQRLLKTLKTTTTGNDGNGKNSGGGLEESSVDRAFEAWGYRALFLSLPAIPLELLNPNMVADRKTIFPILGHEGIAGMQPSARSELRTLLLVVENEFLADENGQGGDFIGGDTEAGMRDVHVVWVVKWVLQTLGLGQLEGFGRNELPRVWKWIERFPDHDDDKINVIDADEAVAAVLEAPYSATDIGVDAKDLLGLKAGERIKVEPNDSELDTHPQYGKLVGLDSKETVIELENGLRIHFPKVGYLVRRA